MFSLREKNLKKTVLIFLIIILIFDISFIYVARSDNATSVKVFPSSQTVNSGENFVVNVYVTPSESLQYVVFNMSFDPSLLQVYNITKGNLFTGEYSLFNSGTIDNDAGEITAVLGGIIGSVNDPGVLVTISFTTKMTTGSSILDLHDVEINGGLAQAEVYDGEIIVKSISQNDNEPPLLSDENPLNGLNEVSVNLSSLNVFIQDSEGDPFSWSIETYPDVGSCSTNEDDNGSKSCDLSALSYSTTYIWFVNATDGNSWTNRSYLFTTEPDLKVNNPPLVSDENPLNNSVNVSINKSSLNVFIQDPEGDPFSWSIKTKPGIGSNSGTSEKNSSIICNISGLSYYVNYIWYVNVTDMVSGKISKNVYFFTTEVFKNGTKDDDDQKEDQTDSLDANVILFFAIIVIIVLIGTMLIFFIIRR